jgi:hypothetical protein
MDIEIENKNRKRRYIEIHITDTGDFTDVALLVDNEMFLDEIEKVRSKYGLHYDFPAIDGGLADDFMRKLLPHSQLRKDFDSDVEKIRKRFYRPTHFNPVIEASIIYGSIGNNTYSRAYLQQQEFFSTENPEEIPDKKYSIVIHQRTREEDVIKTLKEFKKMVDENINLPKGVGANYETGVWADLSMQQVTDTGSSFKIFHKWYISEKTPLELALDEMGYSREDYLQIKKATKAKFIDPFKEQDNKKYQINAKKLEQILSKRNSIKEQLREYRKFLRTSNTTIQLNKFVNS